MHCSVHAHGRRPDPNTNQITELRPPTPVGDTLLAGSQALGSFGSDGTCWPARAHVRNTSEFSRRVYPAPGLVGR
jgi:hypothetical protein